MSTPRPRLAVAVAIGLLVVGGSYVVQRLWDASSEPPMTAVRKMAMIPYYWRVGAALLHGVVGGTVAWVAIPSPSEAALVRLAASGVVLAVAGAIAVLVVP